MRGILRPDGTADLSGTNLPADQVAAACDRIDALAHRLEQAGYPSLLTWIRADIYPHQPQPHSATHPARRSWMGP